MNSLIWVAWLVAPFFCFLVLFFLVERGYAMERKQQKEEEAIRDKEREERYEQERKKDKARRARELEEWRANLYGDRK